MKTHPFFFTLIILALSACMGKPAAVSPNLFERDADGPNKLALIIGISNYPERKTGYKPLNAKRDLELMTAALEDQGFSGNIATIVDGQATQEGIRFAFEQLYAASQPGDVVVIHYSGHGGRMTDNNGDEKVDGLDEVIVPYDAPANWGEKGDAYAASDEVKHIRDDELGELLQRLREKVGAEGNVVLFLDSCYSGTGARNPDGPQPRGTDKTVGTPAPVSRVEGEEAGGLDLEIQIGLDATGLGKFVVFSGSAKDELNYETKDDEGNSVGSLSLAVSKALANMREGDTYRALFSSIANDISTQKHKQTPQLEGDKDVKVFGGEIVVQADYYTVDRMDGENALILDGGSLTGLMVGTELIFYRAGVNDPETTEEKPLARGVVYLGNELAAGVKLAEIEAGANLKTAWGFVTKQGFGNLKIHVRVDVKSSVDGYDRLLEELESLKVVSLVKGKEDLVIESVSGENPSAVRLRTAIEHVPMGTEKSLTQVSELAQLIENIKIYTQSRYLKKVKMERGKINVELTLVPATHQYDDFDGSCLFSDKVNFGAVPKDGYWQLGIGDGYLLHLKNHSSKKVHVAILDLLPDGSIKQLVPYGSLTADEFELAKGQEMLIEDLCFSASPPTGTEVLKLFASIEPIDFEPILMGIRSPDSEKGDFEKLVEDVNKVSENQVYPVRPSYGGTSDVVIQVVDK